ncbi:glycosyltransferase family 2 protein [Paenibacillus sp. JX-17]|uniref:Glycosyltransferase family 2 protein n=1 Tax=Paenibacillus lacisoli TaxID=3064525 RepID=A0ABT9CFH3_9BACL|nr:glycosyltransferase family 2 protein [Paenibacillus sp. JX-17]MDO7907630.1 glycosyltransferase family 2 protein [Paenibacillus sp. JX-17]
MITISLCMIVKNEENVLRRCMDSVHDLVDEIIIVDTGSSDRTKEIAAEYTSRIFDLEWTDDFAAARNYAFEQAAMQYIMWLDADDVLHEQDRIKFAQLKQTLSWEPDAMMCNYHLAFDEHGNAAATSRRYRLVKRSQGYRWRNPVHEYLDITGGKVLQTDIAVSHYREGDHTARNISILQKWMENGGKLEGRMLFFYANELLDQRQYREAAECYEDYFRESVAYREDRIAACSKLAECYHHLGQKEKKLDRLIKSFHYDVPHADICCSIAGCFEEREEWALAIYWYERALESRLPEGYMGVVNLACFTWLPHFQLCLCYARLGQLQQALEHNGHALSYLPEDANLLENKRRLEQALGIGSVIESLEGSGNGHCDEANH